ncbi:MULTISPECIES: ABC transporter substrate-binding protein [unclassified Sporosarcina]|uniref:ABC transporter substrate-binding protein n=1 Tax=unclassified Sporosarcina TaxID=2647733 RepID=UPI00207F8774|nr:MULTISPECIES: ABC transporter substrate-binding protein [unclassified Sporosarcina]GKV63986.1 ABC transporter substrate-binding protein [Sporosarcina sp. NCCP-2331]GLB54767.1 ABC transporter substrate-binding protein [Sporosarcina sp. NCCP-2378]
MKGKMMPLFILCLLVGILSACGNKKATTVKEDDKADEQTRKDELVLAIGSEPEDGFDPITGWGRYGSPLFQSTLLSYDENFQLVGDLATDYSLSEDSLEWQVKIRQNIQFSDGEAVRADDVVFTFSEAKNSNSVIDLSNLESIHASDDNTVIFTLKQPDSTFIAHLASIGIVPQHAYNEKYHEKPIGSGPYQLVEWNRGQQLIVEKNPYYYGNESFFKRLTFLFTEADAAYAAAQAGQVDVAVVQPRLADKKVDGMKLVELESVDNRGIVFPYVPSGQVNDNGDPIGNDVTSDPLIRKAINMAVNRKELVENVLEGYGTPAYSVADQLPWWNPDTAFEDGNLDEAANMLDEAGWQMNSNGVREKDGIPASFTLLYATGDEQRQSLAMAFASMMQPLGIEVETAGKSWNDLERLMHSHPVLFGWGSHTPLEMYHLYSTSTTGKGYYNPNYYSNKKVDEYMEKAIHANSPEEANEYWKKAQWDGEIGFSVAGDAPWAWLVNVEHLYVIREDLEIGRQKIQPHGHGWPMTDFIQNWRLIE